MNMMNILKFLPQINKWDKDPKRIKDGSKVPKILYIPVILTIIGFLNQILRTGWSNT